MIPVAVILAAGIVVRRRSYPPLVQLAAAVVSSILLRAEPVPAERARGADVHRPAHL